MLTQKELKSLLRYDHLTGIFTWLPRTEAHFVGRCKRRRAPLWNSCFARKTAGSTDYIRNLKYTKITLHRIKYKAHRLAWLYMTGRFPLDMIDHIDGNGLNNKIENLREVNNAENKRNTRRHSTNKSGFNGVCWNKAMRMWTAQLVHDNVSYHLGQFKTKQEAIEARKAANIKYGFHPNHGRA